ncbi:hypothetical protein TCAL_14050 [Tigriopus californicus]|uniref:BTB domain-containing protein n=1 Tax=Tigriopus californicus TaxID=6832 RepID=A0A553PHC9_TIGCA|nr:hypothetical protein TCAL_14050 [Tigriopus californicus]|eukprot:TCALIF_14050-PA protein Name:"Similar to lolal Longitudinals lacking protein-like (Drosophila melanogaster)" AED:0.29 eAED:0.32 QI:0/0/0/0.5/1/1/2/0/226
MAGLPADDFCLKWNDHHSIFFASVERLCQLDTLTDVTLSCGAQDFTAHKLVLSVCSGYFARLFSAQRSHVASPDLRTAIVYLKDVNPRHMELLLSYMYRGEINVQESELPLVLQDAPKSDRLPWRVLMLPLTLTFLCSVIISVLLIQIQDNIFYERRTVAPSDWDQFDAQLEHLNLSSIASHQEIRALHDTRLDAVKNVTNYRIDGILQSLDSIADVRYSSHPNLP